METDHGTRPATPASPAPLAKQEEQPTKSNGSSPRRFSTETLIEFTYRAALAHGPAPEEDDGAGEADIEAAFRLKLAGLRRLPRRERRLALRAALQWRAAALQALREKRARERHSRYMAWLLRRPAPRPPG